MTNHPFQPDLRKIPAGHYCAICGKPRTFSMHDGEGELEPIDPGEDEPQMSQEEEQALLAEQIRRNKEAIAAQQPTQQQDEPMPTEFFSIRATPQGTEVILVVPSDIPNEQVLGAVIAFMDAVKPIEVAPETKKGKK